MPRRTRQEIQVQQLRSFCETARLGSLLAAAESLGLAQPTVCEQVHALERAIGLKLVERHRHGVRPTEAGRLVAEMATPLVSGVQSLKRAVHEALAQAEVWLTVGTTQRILIEDLPPVIVEFERRRPDVRLRLLEMRHEHVTAAVEAGEVDLGLTLERQTTPPRPTLVFEPVYELEHFLVMPAKHPLTRLRDIQPASLTEYPLVNSPQGFANPAITATLEQLGVFQRQPRRVEAFYSAVIRRYVELGFGIGLVIGLPGHVSPSPALHERSMAPYFGRETVNLAWRDDALPRPAFRAFADTIRETLMAGDPASRSARARRRKPVTRAR